MFMSLPSRSSRSSAGRRSGRDDDQITAGAPFPLGAFWDGRGTNFAVFSEVATDVHLCIFESDGERQIRMPERTDNAWHVYVRGVGPGAMYGFRVNGPWSPEHGQRCNRSKLLLDPYARAISGDIARDEAVLPYVPGSDGETRSDADSAPFVPRSIVIDPAFDWQGDKPPRRPLADTVIYELHVKGFSARNPEVPEQLRGTYAGLGHRASVDYLKALGVTAVELLPVHQFLTEGHIAERGLRNYWGYNSIGFFAPHAGYASVDDASARVREFKAMVHAFHEAGIEVILDVVYNHTAEGNHLGPMVCFKGLDNQAYYRTAPDSARHYLDFAGTGNTLNTSHPQTLQLVMDSLRYWVTEMHVDGFRFDLAVALARNPTAFDWHSPFLSAVAQDPTLRPTKLIAEPWDVVDGGYQVGHFPVRWSEWNGRYRDTVRDYWRSQPGMLGDFATRLTGSADLYHWNGRSPVASINCVTVHDGFTLRDLVSYNDKHNDANGEENRDGTNDNRAWNLGAEGPTDDPQINDTRARQVRNFLATLLLSHGVPMILGGDEGGRSQGGNNNAYCQDNETSWVDWAGLDRELVDFTRRLLLIRARHGAFRRSSWPQGRETRRLLADLAWFSPGGTELTGDDWTNADVRAFALFLDDRLRKDSARARRGTDADRFLLAFNAALEPTTFKLPAARWGWEWCLELDTAERRGLPSDATRSTYHPGDTIERPPLSLLVLCCSGERPGSLPQAPGAGRPG